MTLCRTALLVIGLILLLDTSSHAQSIRMSYTGTPGFMTPFWMIQEAGLLKKQGLRGEQIMVTGGATNIQALIAGEVDFINAAGPPLINAVLKGADLTIIASSYNFLPYGLMVTKDIRSGADLKGKKVTLSNFGGLEEFAIRLALNKLNVDPNSITFIRSGADGVRIAALVSGAASAMVVSPPSLFRAESLGLKVLVDFGELNFPFATSIIIARRPYIAEQRETAKKFLMAYIEALHLFKTNKKLAVQTMQKVMKLNDPELASRSHDFYTKNTPTVPFTDPTAVKNAAPADRPAIKPEDFYDNSLLREITNSGYAEKLEKQNK
ncbi:MAG TPA: ABC transporter substrate-binding protein [Candidatus Binatia bacterium]|jgi:ABC-type nitrate/sulfonate/bicarbonate transport system substrate-binding protein